MTLSKKKELMYAYKDFYGGSLRQYDKMDAARTDEDLMEIIDEHEAFMEQMLADAVSHLEHFKKRLFKNNL